MAIHELTTYWQVIKKRLWLIGLLIGATLGVMLLIFYLSKPNYLATASFQVTTPLPAEVTLINEFRTVTSREELGYTRNNFVAVLKSDLVIGQVIEELGLDMDVGELLGQMVLEPSENSDFVKLSVTAKDPKLAAAIANTVIDKASQYFGELSAASLTANKRVIEQELEDTGKELEKAQTALIQFQIKNKIGSPDGFIVAQERMITTAEENRDQALAEGNKEVAARYDEIIAARQQKLQEQIPLNSEYRALQWNVKEIETDYTTLLSKQTEVELKEKQVLSAEFISTIPAREPSRPLPRFDPRILLIGAIASLALGITIAFGLEYSSSATAATNDEDRVSTRPIILEPR